MKVINLICSPNDCNSYFVTQDGENGVLIDCGGQNLYNICLSRGYKVSAVLLTHGHFDHVGGCAEFAENGVPVYCGEGEEKLIFCDGYRSICPYVRIKSFEITRTLREGESLEICGINFKVLSTAGHSAGSVCYIAENRLFSGDTLFAGGFGRYDFYTGSFAKLKESIKKLFALPSDYTVYSGHGLVTTLSAERETNPIRQYLC